MEVNDSYKDYIETKKSGLCASGGPTVVGSVRPHRS